MAWGQVRAWCPFPLIMQNIDTETIGQIIQSLAIMAVALALFVHVPNNMFFQNVFKRRTGTSQIGLGEQLRGENVTARS